MFVEGSRATRLLVQEVHIEEELQVRQSASIVEQTAHNEDALIARLLLTQVRHERLELQVEQPTITDPHVTQRSVSRLRTKVSFAHAVQTVEESQLEQPSRTERQVTHLLVEVLTKRVSLAH